MKFIYRALSPRDRRINRERPGTDRSEWTGGDRDRPGFDRERSEEDEDWREERDRLRDRKRVS